MQNDAMLDAYVAAALELHGLVLDDARLAEVQAQFRLLNGMAALFLQQDLAPDVEPAPVYRL